MSRPKSSLLIGERFSFMLVKPEVFSHYYWGKVWYICLPQCFVVTMFCSEDERKLSMISQAFALGDYLPFCVLQ